MTDVILVFLLLWHVTSAIIWYGSVAAFVFIFSPSLREIDARSRDTILMSCFPRFSNIWSASAVSTLAGGIVVFGYVSSLDSIYTPTNWRLFFIIIGAIMGLVSAILALGVLLPLSRKIRIERNAIPVSANKDNLGSANSETVEASIKVLSTVFIILTLVIILMTLGFYF